jgi:hypothetical protein
VGIRRLYVRVPFGRVTGRAVDGDPNAARHMRRTRHLRPVAGNWLG